MSKTSAVLWLPLCVLLNILAHLYLQYGRMCECNLSAVKCIEDAFRKPIQCRMLNVLSRFGSGVLASDGQQGM
jgi:hypothetical protein